MIDVIVIGAGLNGLVAAAALAKQKLKVTLLEQEPIVGGAAITSEFSPGYRAPTLSHSLGPLSRDVTRALGLDRAGVEFITPTTGPDDAGHRRAGTGISSRWRADRGVDPRVFGFRRRQVDRIQAIVAAGREPDGEARSSRALVSRRTQPA